MLLRRWDGDAEGGDLVEVVLRLDHAHERRVRAARGDVERGLAAAVAEAAVRAEVEQRAHRLGVAAVHREVQGRVESVPQKRTYTQNRERCAQHHTEKRRGKKKIESGLQTRCRMR